MEEDSRRVKRTTRFSGDYQKLYKDLELGSSEEDADSDDAYAKKRKPGKPQERGKKARTKECPGCGSKLSLAIKQCGSCDYQFSSKSMLVANGQAQQSVMEESQSIRDRFLFEPEREDDGTLLIQSILGRRPRHLSNRWSRQSATPGVSLADMSANASKFDYEYLVKYKGLSFLHVQWLSAAELDSMNKKSKQVLLRYLNRLDKGEAGVPEDGEIDPSYLEVEKILDVREEEVMEVVDDAAEVTTADTVEDVEETKAATRSGKKVSASASEAAGDSSEAGPELEVGEQRVSNKVLNHPERCRHILERIWDDPYAISFREPVDTNEYDDYLDIVEEPMCLKDVKAKLDAGAYNKYMQYRLFAKDMRLIWENCKNYNLYKSQIWYTAHSLSLHFERLYQSWLLMFVDSSISIEDPQGQPWCATCRVCLNDDNDEKMMLCDHCDAPFHTYCLKPPLAKVPEDAWTCKRCVQFFASHPTANMFSATAEEEARSIADNAGQKKVIRVKKKKYLVKWRGLSYKDCTWETAKHINDDEKIAEYHKLNDAPPEEPPLTQAEIGVELSKDRRTQLIPALKDPNAIQDLDAEIYAQIRTLHFIRWNRIAPDALLNECGPATCSFVRGSRTSMLLPTPIATAVASMKDASSTPAIKAAVVTDSSKGSDASSPAKPEASQSRFSDHGGAVEMEEEKEAEDSEVVKPVSTTPKFPPAAFESLQWVDPIRRAVDSVSEEVMDVVGCMVHSVARSLRLDPFPSRPKLPPPLAPIAELEVCVAKGSQSLCMKVGNFKDRAVILGFRANDAGKKGPAELTGRIKPGDIIVGVNGLSLLEHSFDSITKLLALNHPYIYLRLLRCSSANYFERIRITREAEPESTAPFDIVGDYMEEQKAVSETRRPFSPRSKFFGVFPAPYGSRFQWVVGGTEDVLSGFEDEEEAAQAHDLAVTSAPSALRNFDADGKLTAAAAILGRRVEAERDFSKRLLSDLAAHVEAIEGKEGEKTSAEGELQEKEEEADVPDFNSVDSRDTNSLLASSDSDSDSDDEGSDVDWASDDSDFDYRPTKEKETVEEGDGPVSRLLRAVNETDFPPLRQDWVNYILEMGQQRSLGDGVVVKARSRIDQLDTVSGIVMDSWESVASASRMLNIPLADINACLTGKVNEAGGFGWKISRTMVSDLDDVDEEDESKKEEAWKSKLYKKTKEYKNGGTLRDYQLNGLNWLLRCWYSKRSSILADEMGLGKTVQVVSFLEHLFDVEGIRGPFLVAVPLSTIEHWKREAEGWGTMGVCLYHDMGGGRDMRDVIREYEWYYKGRSRRLLKFHILITTYDDLIRDYEELAEVPWRVVVVDEAHRLRNSTSKLLECMRSVVAKGLSSYGYQHRILMTGTPLQNNTAELWSLLNFIEPAKFPDADKFAQRFGNIQTQEQVEALQRRIAPHLLRRVKEDVAKDIPPKEETIIDVELTTMQKQFYRAIFEHNHGFLMQSLKSGSMPKLMNIQMELRKCCNHPFLIHGVEQTEMETLEAQALQGESGRGKKFDSKKFIARRMEEVLIPTSGKMVLLDKLLPKLRKEGHKVLIFSQMVKMIDLIEEFCEFRQYSVERLDGRVGGNDRQKAIDRFNRDADSFIFLLSTRAGGVGINLTAADTVIIFDSDWNPQNDVQAMARCHRIGQSKHVTIYRLITRRSFEAEMFERASKKLGLEQAVLGSRQFNDQDVEESQKSSAKMDAKEMEQLLREGAYAVLMDEDAEESKAFYDQDIDSILEQRAHVLVSEAAPTTESWLNKSKKPRARKSMFTGEMAMEHAEIDVNDPDFWKKVLPDLVTPDIMLERLSGDFLEDSDDVENRDAVEKYMKDLSQMMDGMLDLNRRGQLPDRERTICMKLLLRITLKEDIFDEDERSQAQVWYKLVEGTRKRNNRQEIRSPEGGAKGGRGGKRGGRGGRVAVVSKKLKYDEEEEDEEEDVEASVDDDYEPVEDADDVMDVSSKKGVKARVRRVRSDKGKKRAVVASSASKSASKRDRSAMLVTEVDSDGMGEEDVVEEDEEEEEIGEESDNDRGKKRSRASSSKASVSASGSGGSSRKRSRISISKPAAIDDWMDGDEAVSDGEEKPVPVKATRKPAVSKSSSSKKKKPKIVEDQLVDDLPAEDENVSAGDGDHDAALVQNTVVGSPDNAKLRQSFLSAGMDRSRRELKVSLIADEAEEVEEEEVFL